MKNMVKHGAVMWVVVVLALISSPHRGLTQVPSNTWNTISGKAYDVLIPIRVEKRGKGHAIHVTYKTGLRLNNTRGLRTESTDLLTHLYYFYIAKELRDDPHSQVTIEAIKKSSSKKTTKKLSQLKPLINKLSKQYKNRLRAFQRLNEKKYPRAITSFKKIRKKVPHDYAQISNAYLYQGKQKKALQTLTAAMKRFPKRVSLINNHAMLVMLQGTFLLEGKHEYDLKKVDEAINILTTAAAPLDKRNWKTQSNLGFLQMVKKDYKKAEGHYVNALKLSQGHPDISYQLGVLYHQQKRWSQAEKHLQSALKHLKAMRSPASAIRLQKIKERLRLVRKRRPFTGK